jgi:hypothetical protein
MRDGTLADDTRLDGAGGNTRLGALLSWED